MGAVCDHEQHHASVAARPVVPGAPIHHQSQPVTSAAEPVTATMQQAAGRRASVQVSCSVTSGSGAHCVKFRPCIDIHKVGAATVAGAACV